MWPFWLMFLVPGSAILLPGRVRMDQERWVWIAVAVFFSILMGFRHEVGGDWGGYLRHYRDTTTLSFAEAVRMSDPAYFVLNWLASQMDGEIYVVNFVCAAVLMWGTTVFCRCQPNPWLALLVAVPYMLIVVGMGYTRQAVALGFVLLGLAALGRGSTRNFVVWIVIGALFHKSAVLLLPVAALAASRNRWLTGALVLVVTALMYYLVLVDQVEAWWINYVAADMQSQGGAMRVAMNAVPALLLIVYRKKLVPDMTERRLWLWIALLALACIPLVFLASTAVDRVALYLIPLQLFVFARLPRLARSQDIRTALVLAIIVYYAAVQYVWLNYAVHAHYWLPYQFMPLS
jgi:hypothetical protein